MHIIVASHMIPAQVPGRTNPPKTGLENRHLLSLKHLIVVATLWDFVIVVFGMAYAPPFQTTTSALGLPGYLMRFFYQYEALFYHAIAIPFVAVLVYATLVIFRTRERIGSFIMSLVTASFVVSSLSALYILLNGSNPLAFDSLWVGLGMGVLAGLGLLATTWPRKDNGQATMNLNGRNLASLCVWVSVVGVLSAAALGAYGATGNSMWGASSSFPAAGLVAAAHEHVVIAVIDAALVGLIVKEFKADLYKGIPGLFVKMGLYGTLLGVPTTTIATYATVPMGIAAHNAITVFAGILLQAALFVTYAIIYTEAKKLKTGFLAGIAKNMNTFGLLFILFWVNVVVTLPGIYVAINLQNFSGQPNEQAFITGHTHVLITLTALALLMLVAYTYGVRGRFNMLGGLTLTSGYLVSSAATVFYIFYDWNPVTSPYIPYIGAGIVLIAFGVLVTLVGIILSKVNPFAGVTVAGRESLEAIGGE